MDDKVLTKTQYFLGSRFVLRRDPRKDGILPATQLQVHSSAFILCGYVGACSTDSLFHFFQLVLSEVFCILITASSALSEVEALGHYPSWL